MPYNTRAILVDASRKPIPQYFDPVADAYQPLYGRNGATRVELYDASGNPITVTSGKLAVRATEIENILSNPLSVLSAGKAEEAVTLQNAATAPGAGTPYTATGGNRILTFEIRGTSMSRTVVFEMAGPSGTYVPCQAVRVTDFALATQTTGGSNSAPESWQVEVPSGWTFRARVSAVSGGDVTIVGKAVPA